MNESRTSAPDPASAVYQVPPLYGPTPPVNAGKANRRIEESIFYVIILISNIMAFILLGFIFDGAIIVGTFVWVSCVIGTWALAPLRSVLRQRQWRPRLLHSVCYLCAVGLIMVVVAEDQRAIILSGIVYLNHFSWYMLQRTRNEPPPAPRQPSHPEPTILLDSHDKQ